MNKKLWGGFGESGVCMSSEELSGEGGEVVVSILMYIHAGDSLYTCYIYYLLCLCLSVNVLPHCA